MKKVNLIYGQGDVLHTHININPFAEDADGENIIRANIMNLDEHVDDAELSELIAVDVIDYIPLNEVNEVLSNWAKKIRIGGKIILGGTDLVEVCKSMSQYRIPITDANELIHGSQTKPYLIKRATFTAIGISDYLEGNFNFTTTKKSVNNYKMIVEATR